MIPPYCSSSPYYECEMSDAPPLRLSIGNPDIQLTRYQQLLVGREDPNRETPPRMACDYFMNVCPSPEARVYLNGGEPTNGAFLWDDQLILIQGPHTPDHIRLMWQIIHEKEVDAIVRLGPIKGYLPYLPSNAYENSIVTCDKPEMLSDSAVLCTNCTLVRPGCTQLFSVYSLEDWRDFEVGSNEDIYRLITELEENISGPIIVHCRAGLGRSGTFAACWRIYQLYKEAVEQDRYIEVNPAGIVEEMEKSRPGVVQTEEQFRMILDFVNFLNTVD